jgi:transcriptional regulator with XRE-family HTH domain
MSKDRESSLLSQLAHLTGQVAGQTLDIAKHTATMSAMFGESWLKSALMKTLEPERLDAMADAGRFLRDARETAGLSLKELTDELGVKDGTLLEDIESGERIMPLELLFRSASLMARHDPIPFLIKFMRTYNPALGATLEQWGILTLPMQYERERRWINLYRQHDVLRTLSDDEYDRLVEYVDSATNLVLDVMQREKAANSPKAKPASKKPAAKKARRKPAKRA